MSEIPNPQHSNSEQARGVGGPARTPHRSATPNYDPDMQQDSPSGGAQVFTIPGTGFGRAVKADRRLACLTRSPIALALIVVLAVVGVFYAIRPAVQDGGRLQAGLIGQRAVGATPPRRPTREPLQRIRALLHHKTMSVACQAPVSARAPQKTKAQVQQAQAQSYEPSTNQPPPTATSTANAGAAPHASVEQASGGLFSP